MKCVSGRGCLERFGFAADALGWAVPNFLLTRTINLNQLGIINVGSESAFDGIKVNAQAVCGELDAMREPFCQIVNEHLRRSRVTIAGHERRNQFCVRVNRNPSPNVSVSEFPFLFGGYVLLFRVAELPNFIALNPLAFQVAESAVLIIGAGDPHVFE